MCRAMSRTRQASLVGSQQILIITMTVYELLYVGALRNDRVFARPSISEGDLHQLFSDPLSAQFHRNDGMRVGDLIVLQFVAKNGLSFAESKLVA